MVKLPVGSFRFPVLLTVQDYFCESDCDCDSEQTMEKDWKLETGNFIMD